MPAGTRCAGIVTETRGIVAVLTEADPELKADLYAELGVHVRYARLSGSSRQPLVRVQSWCRRTDVATPRLADPTLASNKGGPVTVGRRAQPGATLAGSPDAETMDTEVGHANSRVRFSPCFDN